MMVLMRGFWQNRVDGKRVHVKRSLYGHCLKAEYAILRQLLHQSCASTKLESILHNAGVLRCRVAAGVFGLVQCYSGYCELPNMVTSSSHMARPTTGMSSAEDKI
jgi:hypothetical protein